MANYKTAAKLYNYDQDRSDDEKTYDDLPSSESEESDDDSSVTEESSDEDVDKMHFIECMAEEIERIEKDIQELEVGRTKYKCPVAQIVMKELMEMLLHSRESVQRRFEEVMHGVQPGEEEPLKIDMQTLFERKIEANTDEKNENVIPEHVYLQVEGTRIDGYPKKDSDGTSALGASFPKQDLKSGDNKQLSSEERTAAEIKQKNIQDALLIGDFDEMESLLSAKPRGVKKSLDGNADLKGGKKKTTAECDIKSSPGTEEKGNN